MSDEVLQLTVATTYTDCGKHYNLRILHPVEEAVQNLEPTLPEQRMHFVHKVLGHHNPRVAGSYFPDNFPVDEIISNMSKQKKKRFTRFHYIEKESSHNLSLTYRNRLW